MISRKELSSWIGPASKQAFLHTTEIKSNAKHTTGVINQGNILQVLCFAEKVINFSYSLSISSTLMLLACKKSSIFTIFSKVIWNTRTSLFIKVIAF